MSDATLKAKLLAALRDELHDRGACIGSFPEADAEGVYLLRADGQMRGVGAYQALDGGAVEDLSLRELAGVLSGLTGLDDVKPDADDDDDFEISSLSGDQLAWAKGERQDYQVGAMEMFLKINDTHPLTPITLATDTTLITRQRGRVVATRTFPAGTEFEQAQVRHGRCIVNGEDAKGAFSFVIADNLIALVTSPSRRPKP